MHYLPYLLQPEVDHVDVPSTLDISTCPASCLYLLLTAVSIASQRETISPLVLGKQDEGPEHDKAGTPRLPQVKSPSTFRLSGRPSLYSSPTLRPLSAVSAPDTETAESKHRSGELDALIGNVAAWIKNERYKLAHQDLSNTITNGSEVPHEHVYSGEQPEQVLRNSSIGSVDLDGLEDILKRSSIVSQPRMRRSSKNLGSKSSIRKLRRKASSASSDTDYFDGAPLVPSCDVSLDNSKTLSYTGGASDSEDSGPEDLSRVASYRDQDAWAKFKFEIVKLAHTLRLKGWRRGVPLEESGNITVQRLSGALTNAVYVVSPPPSQPDGSNGTVSAFRRPPPKLLLRLYGPNVEHLIDRQIELAILQRLARKRIGPRLLGTFANGRFEEYFHARPLTPEDLRDADTSRQIAKRMRELHDGIELLDQERDDGPFVWRNWDKWVQRVEHVVCWLDSGIAKLPAGHKPTGSQSWKRRGYICGLQWKDFRAAVEKYRGWLEAQYGGAMQLRAKLVFAHNDTQYGNILRMVPTGDSPLLLPANTHKQLVVIDFEYANANLPGLEFANHFTEWCYNYHDQRKPYAFHTNRYPTPEEQDHFVRAYVRHRPQFNVSTPQMTPESGPTPSGQTPGRRPTTSISEFMLDARNPSMPSVPIHQSSFDEAADKSFENAEVARLLHEVRIWRLANTAQWVAWGIVQAKVVGMPEFGAGSKTIEDSVQADFHDDAKVNRELEQDQAGEDKLEAEQEEFDYLGYAQHRAMFFWADAIQLGIVKAEDLPEDVRSKLKTVPC